MSLPDMDPKKSVSGITIDPYTRERVIPESRRADGSLRQQRKVRPGYTPQEDVSLFRGSRQTVAAAQNRNAPGYLPPGAAPKVPGAGAGGDKPLSKAAAKNAKRRAKKQAEKEDAPIKDNWDSDSDGDKSGKKKVSSGNIDKENKKEILQESNDEEGSSTQESRKEVETAGPPKKAKDDDADLTAEVAKLNLGS
ncbi:hypothetical protein SCHPADRAFT_823297 [Schizopora paradoxa]|uniref:WIBG Mago-binding domain-containing protein n=1 Tax=Schizopora paradoxa TaxID=27342 RepID=A0A0H2SGW1_9AGAM|nr:hypothetical protein SCHPADRAFT_823297 [Schizopora paradoxa]